MVGKGGVDGSCHCGVVQLRVASLPVDLNDCQCEHCQKRGALWAYYRLDQVEISGPTSVYVWGDHELEFHFCARCGCTTHWMPIDRNYDRMGLNARVLGKSVIQSTPVRRGEPPAAPS
jgi:hypothetical protein